MNDSISVSSSYSSSTNSNSNSLNRSLIANGSFLLMANGASNTHGNTLNSSVLGNSNSLGRQSRMGALEDYLNLPITPVRRRARSQTIYFGDELNTISEYNKQLIEDLYLLKKKLKEKDDTIAKLNDIRNKLESEIQELSASLFEEAYLMVNTARAEAAQSEKLLKEANGKIDVLQAEVKALKELVLTSTPNTPNKHLHPQLSTSGSRSGHSRQSSLNQQSFNSLVNTDQTNTTILQNSITTSTPSSNNNNNIPHIITSNKEKPVLTHSATSLQPLSGVKEKSSFFTKSHKRAPSHNDIQIQSKSILDKLFQSNKSQDLKSNNLNVSNYNQTNNSSLNNSSTNFGSELAEFDPIYFKELLEWKENPDLVVRKEFLKRVYEEDILPCLNFNNKKLSEELLEAIESNRVCIEELSITQQQIEPFAQETSRSIN